MIIDKYLAEIAAIHASFDDLVSHGRPAGEFHVTVSVAGIVELHDRIERFHESMREAWIESRANRSRSELQEIQARLGQRANA